MTNGAPDDEQKARLRWVPYYTIIGELISKWDRVELACEILFAELMDSNNRQSSAIYNSCRSSDLKFDMLINYLKVANCNHDIREEIEISINSAKKLSAKRNHIIHGQWILTHYIGDDPEDFAPPLRMSTVSDFELRENLVGHAISRNPKYQKQVKRYIFTINDMNEIINEINSCSDRLFHSYRRLRASHEK